MADERQNLHANKIAAERVLMDATGMTRNQLRQSVKNSMTSFVDAFQARHVREQQESAISRRDSLRVEHPQIFKTPPFQPFVQSQGELGTPGPAGAAGADGADGFTLDGVDPGDMIYWSGSGWILLSAPTGFTNDPVLRHNGSYPYWEEPGDC